MSNVRQQYRSYTIVNSNTIELAAAESKLTFRKLWIYPGNPSAGGTLTVNGAKVLIGIDGDGPRIARDPLNPTDQPRLYEAPEVNGSVELQGLNTILVYGTAGDSITLVWWP